MTQNIRLTLNPTTMKMMRKITKTPNLTTMRMKMLTLIMKNTGNLMMTLIMSLTLSQMLNLTMSLMPKNLRPTLMLKNLTEHEPEIKWFNNNYYYLRIS